MKKRSKGTGVFVIIVIMFYIMGIYMIPKVIQPSKWQLYGYIYLTLMVIFIYGWMLWVRYQAKKELEQLSDTLQELLNTQSVQPSIKMEDTMLSKLQNQVIRILRMHKKKEEIMDKERNNIASLVSDITHQLKTPLANLYMYHQFVMDSQETANESNLKQRMDLTVKMQSQIEKLNWLMEGLMKVSKLESGLISLKPENTSIGDTVLTAIKQAYLIAEEKNIQIAFRENNKVHLKHDVKWTAEAIYNILDNAIKYSSHDTDIRISIIPYEIFLRIDVQDEGIGIQEKEINKIFQRFYRSQAASREKGVGIGLYLTREIITRQGGYIKVKSTEGKGSLFSIFLPM